MSDENAVASDQPSLLDSVSALFLPHVRYFVGPAVKEEMRGPVSGNWLAIAAWFILVSPSEKEIAEEIVLCSRVAARVLSTAWLQALYLSAMDHELFVSWLDDAMLPSLGSGVAEALAASAAQFPGCGGHEREILRRVKVSLPVGTSFPAEAAAWLAAAGVAVVPWSSGG